MSNAPAACSTSPGDDVTDFTTELVQKPNFEDGQIGDWTRSPQSDLSIVSTTGPGFTKALEATASVALGDVAESAAPIAASPGQIVYIDGWLGTLASTTDASAIVGFADLSGAYFAWPGVNILAAVAGWSHAVETVTAPANIVWMLPGWVSWHAAVGDILDIGPQSRSFYDPARPAWLWLPSYTPQAKYAPRVLDAKFGDGYQQRATDGINASPETWDLQFLARTAADAQAMIDFFNARAGVESFQWIAPDNTNGAPNVPLVGNPKLYIARKYTMSRTSPLLYEVSVTFKEVFDL